MTSSDVYRELGSIHSATAENRHNATEPNTVWIGIDFDGYSQAFGGVYLPIEMDRLSFVSAVTTVFGCNSLESLVGRRCYALRSFSSWNSPIVGLESEKTRRRITINDWRRSRGFNTESGLDVATESLKNGIKRARREAIELEEQLLHLHKNFKNWDKDSKHA